MSNNNKAFNSCDGKETDGCIIDCVGWGDLSHFVIVIKKFPAGIRATMVGEKITIERP